MLAYGMSFIAKLILRDPILFGETFKQVPDAECTLENVHYTTNESGATRYVFFFWKTGCAFSEFGAALSGDPTVNEFRVITEIATKRLYRITTKWFPADQPLVFPFFREHDITALESKRTKSGLHLEARFPSREALRAFKRIGTELGSGIEVSRLYTEDTPLLEYALTEKQRETLVLAAREGYFETPSDVTLASLASDLDISPQAVSKHIRAAVRKLVECEIDHPSVTETG